MTGVSAAIAALVAALVGGLGLLFRWMIGRAEERGAKNEFIESQVARFKAEKVLQRAEVDRWREHEDRALEIRKKAAEDLRNPSPSKVKALLDKIKAGSLCIALMAAPAVANADDYELKTPLERELWTGLVLANAQIESARSERRVLLETLRDYKTQTATVTRIVRIPAEGGGLRSFESGIVLGTGVTLIIAVVAVWLLKSASGISKSSKDQQDQQ